MSYYNGPRIVTDGLVLYLNAGSKRSYPEAGATWADLSSSKLSATLVGSYSFVDGAISFTSNGYARVLHNSIYKPTAAITFGAWAYKSDWTSTTDSRIISTTENGGWHMGLNQGSFIPSGNTGLLAHLGGTYRSTYVASSTLLVGWNYLIGTFDGQYLRFYLNGVNVSTYDNTSTTTVTYAVDNAMQIGAEAGPATTPGGQYFNNPISMVKIYNRALSAEEVLQNYNAIKKRYGH